MPSRSNRGVPPKRYDPELEAQKSKYPLKKLASKQLTVKAKAFKTALYSKNIPRGGKEALTLPEWKEVMQVEMDAMKKNQTWEKCMIPLGKRPIGCK